MLSTLVYTSLFVLAPALRAAAFSVNSPEIKSCQDTQISWEAKQGPYDVWVINPDDPCPEKPYLDLGADHQGTTMTFKAGLPEGLKVQLSIQDANGEEAWSDVITVKKGNDASCVPKELAALAPKPEVKSSSAAAAPSSESKSGSTLVVTPTQTVQGAQPTDNQPLQAAGAAAGITPNGAASVRSVGTPVVLFGAIAGAVMLFL